MTYTNRARTALLLTPLILPYLLCGDILCALIQGGCEAVDALHQNVSSTLRMWYREVYRVARYGSVYDER